MSGNRAAADPNVRADGNGQFTTALRFRRPSRIGTLHARGASAAGKLTASEFDKPFSDEELNERDSGRRSALTLT